MHQQWQSALSVCPATATVTSSVTFFHHQIATLVTHSCDMVDSWIANVEYINRRRLHRLVVGLDVEWRPNRNNNRRSSSSRFRNPVATLQLCVCHECLIFQLLYADEMPQSLVDFLADDDYTFVGVGIDDDAEKLSDDYDLEVCNAVDLCRLGSRRTGRRELRNAGLTNLAMELLGVEYEKPRNITLSKCDKPWLSDAKVQYACIDAFLSYKIGRSLNAAQ